MSPPTKPRKLTPGEVKRLVASGVPKATVARRAGVSPSTLHRDSQTQKETTLAQRSKKTPVLLERMVALHAEGGSNREIAELLGVSAPAIGRWLDEAGLKSNGGQGPRAKRRRPAPRVEDAAAAEALRVEGELAAGKLSGRDMLSRRVSAIRALLDQGEGGLAAGDFSAPLFERLCRLEAHLAKELVALEPTVVTAGRDDEAAAAAFDRKLRALVERAEASAKCSHCGRRPW